VRRGKILSDDIENDILHGVKRIVDYMPQLGFEMKERRYFDWVADCRTHRFPTLHRIQLPASGPSETWGDAIKRALSGRYHRAPEMIPRLGREAVQGALTAISRGSTLPLRSSRPHMTRASSYLDSRGKPRPPWAVKDRPTP
jgi:hypothetical protein